MRNIIYKNEKLSKYSWFNLGGPAEILFKPNSIEELKNFLIKKKINYKNIFVLGAGSNTLFRDTGFNGFVIKLGKQFTKIKLLEDNKIEVGAATLDKKLADFALQNEISGFEFLSCIPGTIGGGLKINSGCYGREFKDILLSVQVIDRRGIIKTIPSNYINFSYRSSSLDKNFIFLSASFKGEKKEFSKIQTEMENLKKEKNITQPSRIKTGGSTFKNPIDQTEEKVWELIKKSVPLNVSFGDASISEKHCNFFVNNGNAKFEDMKKLINFVSESVFKKTGIKLEKEIKILE